MKKLFFLILSFIQLNLFAQDVTRFNIFQKTETDKINNKWVTTSSNEPCNYTLEINSYKITISVDKNHYWEVYTTKGEVVQGKLHTVEYDCQDRLGQKCKMILSWIEGNDDIASMEFNYPDKQIKWDFRER